jgi:AcrR family transcriptional regulator
MQLYVIGQYTVKCFGKGVVTMVKKVDRRIQRTQNMLIDAFLDLMIEKGYDAITVQDIIDRADVGRSTFYAHFTDKEQLFLSSLDQLRDFLKEQSLKRIDSTEDGKYQFGFSLAMLQHVQSNKLIFKATVRKKGGAMVQQHMQRMLFDLVQQEMSVLLPYTASLSVPQEVVVQFVVNTFYVLLSWWVEENTPCSAVEVDRIFHQLTLSGLGGLNK